MLLRHHFFLPLLLLLVMGMLATQLSVSTALWVVIFLISSSLLLLLGAFGSLRRFDRLLGERQFEKIQRQLRPVWLEGGAGRTKRLAGLYLAASYLGRGEMNEVDQAAEILQQIPPDHLAPHAKNRYWICQAQICLYRNQAVLALENLKRCTLFPIHVHLFTQLFLYFSISFFLTQSEPERCQNFATKACELSRNDPLCQAQLALVSFRLQNQLSARQQIEAALAHWPRPYHAWELKLYEAHLRS